MERFKNNPILEPLDEHPWESRMVFNASAVHEAGRVHILYRALGDDGVSRLGYASSKDGYEFDERLSTPVFEPSTSEELEGCEDPRMTPLEGQYFMCYTALRNRISGPYQISITSIGVDDFVNKRWRWGSRWLPFSGIRNKDAALFPKRIDGRYLLIHRIEPDICVAYSDDLVNWCNMRAIVSPRRDSWDSLKVGIACPPIDIDAGWLLIYHGMDFNRVYRLGSILLDKNNPEKVIYRSKEPVLEPVEEYERYGSVPNVVFSCGAVKIRDEILVYYGGADSVLCVANCNIDELIHDPEILTSSS